MTIAKAIDRMPFRMPSNKCVFFCVVESISFKIEKDNISQTLMCVFVLMLKI